MHIQDLHTHSLYDDGAASLRDMAQAAVSSGLSSFGFSGHSHLPGEFWTMPEEKLADYFREARQLQAEYRGRLSIFCGLEWDVGSPLPEQETDYMIGSVHRLQAADDVFNVDHTAEALAEGVERLFGGDRCAAEEAYYKSFLPLLGNPRVSIVGHFDLISKFDENHELYREAPDCALEMMQKLVTDGKIFEVNTGAISRGYRITPYLSGKLLGALHEMGGKVTLSSDSHNTNTLSFGFDDAIRRLKAYGFSEIWILTHQGFAPEAL